MEKIFKLEIRQIFELQDSDKEKIELLSNEEISNYTEELRDNLEYAGKRCGVHMALLTYIEKEIDKCQQIINNGGCDEYVFQRWLYVIQTHKDVYEMMGYLTLLQMDALTTSISLYQAKNDTERIMHCKHAYTIIYEAIENDLFKKVAAGIKKYPEELKEDDVFRQIWKEISSILKQMLDINEAKEIRNNIDAHKCHSFATQINAYKKCRWGQSIYNLHTLIKIIDVIQKYMDIINKQMTVLYEKYKTDMEERMKQYEGVMDEIKRMQQSDMHN